MKKIIILSLIALPFGAVLSMEKDIPQPQIKSTIPNLLIRAQNYLHRAVTKIEKLPENLPQIESPSEHSQEKAQLFASPFEEAILIETRQKKANNALSELLNEKISLEDTPTFGICGSGGGSRAALEITAFLKELNALHMLNICSYMTGLSGSTWSLSTLIASGLSIEEFQQRLFKRLTKTPKEVMQSCSTETIRKAFEKVIAKSQRNLSINLIDVYAFFLGQLFLTNLVENPHEYTMSSLKKNLNEGTYPFFIATAVTQSDAEKNRISLEFSPTAFGSHEQALKSFIQPWAIGREFDNGISQKSITKDFYASELSLCYILGMLGSAFSTDLYSILDTARTHVISRIVGAPVNPLVVEASHAIISTSASYFSRCLLPYVLGSEKAEKIAQRIEASCNTNHFSSATIPNFAYNVKENKSSQIKDFAVVDGAFQTFNGNRLNVAIAPLLHRGVELILMCDSSEVLDGAPSLKAAEDYAKSHQLPFPHVDYSKVEKCHASVIIDQNNLDAPVIVYMPGIRNKKYNEDFDPTSSSFTRSVNFTYTEEQSKLLSGLIEHNVRENKDVLKQAFKQALERKRKKRSLMTLNTH